MLKYLYINWKFYILQIRITKGGPAFTFEIELPNGKIINIDLVPVLEFSKDVPFMDPSLDFKQFKVHDLRNY